ncbi:hypothetical protein [Streptomyces sp. NPDC016626]|uniref:hypothetical protein n=1 Tax=Streptomyces sp. NPDC016626 TaxID=3364968 RepID=UPI0036FCA3D7
MGQKPDQLVFESAGFFVIVRQDHIFEVAGDGGVIGGDDDAMAMPRVPSEPVFLHGPQKMGERGCPDVEPADQDMAVRPVRADKSLGDLMQVSTAAQTRVHLVEPYVVGLVDHRVDAGQTAIAQTLHEAGHPQGLAGEALPGRSGHAPGRQREAGEDRRILVGTKWSSVEEDHFAVAGAVHLDVHGRAVWVEDLQDDLSLRGMRGSQPSLFEHLFVIDRIAEKDRALGGAVTLLGG